MIEQKRKYSISILRLLVVNRRLNDWTNRKWTIKELRGLVLLRKAILKRAGKIESEWRREKRLSRLHNHFGIKTA